jgi:hypothetical protein
VLCGGCASSAATCCASTACRFVLGEGELRVGGHGRWTLRVRARVSLAIKLLPCCPGAASCCRRHHRCCLCAPLHTTRPQPRDLRRIDPTIDFTKASPSITIKEDVLLLNLGGIR